MEDLFLILIFGWVVVTLFIIAQCAIWAYSLLEKPKVWKWRRK